PVHGVALSGSEPIPKHVVGIIQVFSDVAPSAAVRFAAVNPEKIEPWVFAPKIAIASHCGAECAEGEPVAAEAGGDKLLTGAFAYEWKAVIGFDNLPEPLVLDLRAGTKRFESRAQPGEDRLRIFLLAGLDVFAAENRVGRIPLRHKAEIVIGVTGIPVERLRDNALGNCRADHVAGVKRKLGLEKCGADEAGFADKWGVSRDHEIVAADFVLPRVDRK